MVTSSQADDSPRAVFLDRDGVLIRSDIRNRKPVAITRGDTVEILDGVEQACRALKEAGFLLVMITNQPDVVRGRTPRAFVDEVNERLRADLALDEVAVCFHDNSDSCDCRKPGPGLLLDVARRRDIDLGASVMVGDRWRDVEAGRRAGCRTVFLDYDYDEVLPNPPDYVAESLLAAVPWITGRC